MYADDSITEMHSRAFGMEELSMAFAQYFKRNSYLNALAKTGELVVFLANVTFEPDVEIIGIFIMLKIVVVRYRFVLMEKVDIKEKEKSTKFENRKCSCDSTECKTLVWNEKEKLV